MTRLFRSQALQDEFDLYGFVRLPLLSASQVDTLTEGYKTLAEAHRNIGLPFTTTSHSNDHELIGAADDMIARILGPEMDKVLLNYRLLFGNFLIKQSGPKSATPLHQDTSFVDESRYSSISVWVSLVDTDQQNGCMRFIRGSHHFRHLLRPTHSYAWPFDGVREELTGLLEDFPSQRGEAFIFHHGIIHASYANMTASPRVAAVMAAYPGEADLLMYFADEKDSNTVSKYKMTKDAYLRFVKGTPPAADLTEKLQADYSPVTPAQLRDMVIARSGYTSDYYSPAAVADH
ncbi:MAG: phytanoyl-CoA dioxygenase family protein [Bacteroidetes bacterium]|nr:phytanoyl-CoA dioxygenase family protein [Bacteroidota bacterium]